jgi:FMN phosphatase YigB (HAD superfamily)
MQHIALDLGNVVFNLDFKDFWQIIAELEVNVQDMEHYIRIIEKQEFCGLATFRDLMEDEFSASSAEMLLQAWNDSLKENKTMTNFLKSLKDDGVHIAFLSNMGINEVEYARYTFPHIFSLADEQHISCEVGVAKPGSLFFQSFLLQHDDYSGCLYLDDRIENIKTGTKCKFNSYQFDLNNFNSIPVLKKELDKIKSVM